MKNQAILMILGLLLSTTNLFAQGRYEQEMTTTIAALDKADNLPAIQAVVNKFEAISRVEKDKWMPKYYASYAYTVMTYFDKNDDSKDKALDNAQQYLDKAKAQSADKEETEILQTYIHQSRFFVSPMGRLKMFMSTTTEIENLIKAYPENPRAYLLQGIQLFHKPAFLGGGASSAKPFFLNANVRYDKQALKTKLDPAWGKDTNEYYLAKCK